MQTAAEHFPLALPLFIALDVIGSIALALWLSSHVGSGRSDWDR